MRFKEFLNESINDKGILKAIFVIGIPGAGKSYTISQLAGTVGPKIVNSDVATEFLSKKFDIESNADTWKSFFKDRTKRITSNAVYGYINGMLPLFVDGTSNDTGNINRRIGILKSVGYDVGMVFVNVDLETAQNRAVERAKTTNRQVSNSFITQVHAKAEEDREYFRGEFKFFKEVDNGPGELDDAAIMKIYRAAAGFYTKKVENPIGIRNLAKMQEKGEKYLTPEVYDEADLKKIVNGWFKS